jgi:hypothetical protein
LQPRPVRLVKPGLLSLAAALTTLGIGGGFLVFSPLVYQSGPWAGAWWNLGNGIVLGFWRIIVTIFAFRLLVDEPRHILLGSVLVGCNALTGIFIMGTYSYQLLASSYLPSVFTLTDELTLIAMMTSPALGVVGGLMGVFWKRSWKQGAAIPGLAGGVAENADRRGDDVLHGLASISMGSRRVLACPGVLGGRV